MVYVSENGEIELYVCGGVQLHRIFAALQFVAFLFVVFPFFSFFGTQVNGTELRYLQKLAGHF